ncbi:hypothetical protein OLMES_5158 [Oleiphilus messinensis]|uniref:Uncharacterized protein n=1 Tax=Oleiphilus messinensis TaxID=141451 RepID=A0A1Y0IF33_9GAMM|nr:hypothetical protein [Oleiphilus messinensis]ARU59142.1 hypothetical protein OLMES_5158 [Oleiphilus messinensis]
MDNLLGLLLVLAIGAAIGPVPAYILAKKKGRSKVLWTTVSFFLLGPVVPIILLVLPINNEVVGSSINNNFEKISSGDFLGQFEKISNSESMDRRLYIINNTLLDGALGGNYYRYIVNFVPIRDLQQDLAIGKIAGGVLGTAHMISSFRGHFSDVKNRARVSVSVGGFGYMFNTDELKSADQGVRFKLFAICAIYCNGSITKSEYVRAMATIFRYFGKPTVPVDTFGEFVFQNDNHKVGTSIGYQYFEEKLVSLGQVDKMLEAKCKELSHDVLKEISEVAENYGIRQELGVV